MSTVILDQDNSLASYTTCSFPIEGGDTLKWKMDMTVPMPMTLNCTATVNGDQMTGTVNAGAFGDMPLTGQRQG